jgi:hypothetical protein
MACLAVTRSRNLAIWHSMFVTAAIVGIFNLLEHRLNEIEKGNWWIFLDIDSLLICQYERCFGQLIWIATCFYRIQSQSIDNPGLSPARRWQIHEIDFVNCFLGSHPSKLYFAIFEPQCVTCTAWVPMPEPPIGGAELGGLPHKAITIHVARRNECETEGFYCSIDWGYMFPIAIQLHLEQVRMRAASTLLMNDNRSFFQDQATVLSSYWFRDGISQRVHDRNWSIKCC